MGLSASLQIGRSALSASQLAIQVTGNNFANASTAGYSRQLVDLAAFRDQQFARYSVGRGVEVAGIRRQGDQALQNRLWSSASDRGATQVDQQVLEQIETTLDELGDASLSARFEQFFRAWSNVADSPARESVAALAVGEGRSLAGAIRARRDDLLSLRTQTESQLRSSVERAQTLLQEITDVNVQIVNSEAGRPSAFALRDQRDRLVSELSGLIEVNVIEQPSGAVNVLVGSTPVVLEGVNRGIRLQSRQVDGETQLTVNVTADDTQLNPVSGSISALLRNRDGATQETLDVLDRVASQLIFQVNRVHSVGYGARPLTSVTGTLAVQASDRGLAFNNPSNVTFSNLPFAPRNGSFQVTVTNTATGASQTSRIEVDLDGVGADSSLNSVMSSIDGLANLRASLNADGTLSVNADSGYTVSFEEDSSGVLAVLGVNAYFTGTSASDIDVRADLVSNPTRLSTGLRTGGNRVDNGAALAISGLRTRGLSELSGRSLTEVWSAQAGAIGAASSAASTRADAAQLVSQNLEAQRAAIAGVDLDEESINLLNYQRMYQGAARFITVVDDLTQTLLGLLG